LCENCITVPSPWNLVLRTKVMDHETIGIIPAQGNHTEEGWLFGQMLTLDQICGKANELVPIKHTCMVEKRK